MRLHQLSVTAFGPFAGSVEVDFDELSAAGLFLLTGPTGAGKTSILDAVCFALYGQVPGDRAGAKHLRSDHAEPQTAPEVVLRFSVGDRQFSFRRAPSWSRPKLRGSGTTKVQAHVLVEELRDGTWTTLTTRLDDAGLLVTDLLGMTCTQFTQVAMLPQGRFQAFLRASSAERHAVLQQLFRTDRFERVERWLVDRRTEARRASEGHLDTVLEAVNRLREVLGTDDGTEWADDLAEATTTGQVQSWAAAALARAEEEQRLAAASSAAADLELAASDQVLAGARATADLQGRGLAAQRQLHSVDARSAELEAQRLRLRDHHRAWPLAELVNARRSSAAELAAASSRWDQVRTSATGLLGPNFTGQDLDDAVRRAQTAHALAVAFAPRDAVRRETARTLSLARTRLQSVEAHLAELEHALLEQPAVIADAVAAVHEARAAAARHPVVQAAATRLQDLVDAARRAELVSLELAAARTDVLTATALANQAKEQYLDIREARINGMAGELAGQLAAGCRCPVCGSAEHPSPAAGLLSGVGRTEEDQARRLSEDAAFELQARQVGLATLEGELAALDERLGGVDRDTLVTELDDAVTETERLEPLVSALDVLVAREQQCRAALTAAESARAGALLERARLSVEVEQLADVLTGVDHEWSGLVAMPGAPEDEDEHADLEQIVHGRRARVQTLEQVVREYQAWTEAVSRHHEAGNALDAAAARAGFGSVEEALDALRTGDEVAALSEELADAEARRTGAEITLGDPHVAEALATEPPDLDLLTEQHRVLTAVSRELMSARSAADSRLARTAELQAQLAERTATWLPTQQHYRTVAGLAALVEGKSVDNPLRMRLAAYVLSERLRQVVDAANERLAGMTEQRYVLEHTDDRGYGEQRGGLSLRVRDDWSGVDRDPATLSGGETFVVSLALALGLADTVAHEAGGTDIDTLFIDEGFGSLDADTLEDVMDTLDSLRDGGRVVGIVSHVPELRSRIATQVEVTKGRTGSTVRTAFGTA